MRGRLPKPANERVTRYKPLEWIEIPNVPYEGPKPDLPDDMPERTKKWWGVVSAMPVCVLWEDDDWQLALDTAYLHAAFAKGDLARAAELRKWQMKLGMTSEGRRALRIRYIEPRPEPVESNVDDLFAQRRRRALGAELDRD
jgi:hypothetical protein